jgi:hypothetical protein
MNKILVGVIVGAILGIIDGATAWFTPAVRAQMIEIIIGSTFKGVIAGVAAGWYANRVRSVPKGIAFGFVVGLVLAFLVAAMPDPSGNHYWWQIMVPGSILGGVIGWATQRYGRPGRATRTAAAMLMLAALALPIHAHDGHEATTTAAFEKLKTLAGTWNATSLTPDGEPTTVEYRITGGGSVVMETMFPGTPHEMINMYTSDGSTVSTVHYCSAGNQPVLSLNAAKSSATELTFEFVSLGGKKSDHYINRVRYVFKDDGTVIEEWGSAGTEEPLTLYLKSRK